MVSLVFARVFHQTGSFLGLLWVARGGLRGVFPRGLLHRFPEEVGISSTCGGLCADPRGVRGLESWVFGDCEVLQRPKQHTFVSFCLYITKVLVPFGPQKLKVAQLVFISS